MYIDDSSVGCPTIGSSNSVNWDEVGSAVMQRLLRPVDPPASEPSILIRMWNLLCSHPQPVDDGWGISS